MRDLLVGKLGIDWQTEDLARSSLGLAAAGGTECHTVAIRRLEVHGHRVVDTCPDPCLPEVCLVRCPVVRTHDIEVENMARTGPPARG